MPAIADCRSHTEALLQVYETLQSSRGRARRFAARELLATNDRMRCRVESGEDQMIFVHDMGRCLDSLPYPQQVLIRLVALDGLTVGELARERYLPFAVVLRQYGAAVDALTAVLVKRRLVTLL